ncbi:hypothetical protein AAVH_29994 [Aphelenchoides avenae]|nr:hypothetical protein AAVH_29994 [Aphelenchus avenae]
MSSPPGGSTDDALCRLAEDYATDGWLSAAQLLQIALSLSAMSLMGYVLCRNGCRRLVIHANFKIMVGNIMALYYMLCVTIVVMQVRFQVMYRTYQNPCDLLTPTWVTIATRGPCYVYIVGFPLWHLAITLERAWSTLRARTYEHEGVAYGICCAIAVWSFSILHTMYIVQLASQDPRFYEPNVYTTITTSTNADFLINTQYALMAVDFFTSSCDFVVIAVNKKNLRRGGGGKILSAEKMPLELKIVESKP